ncbi:putative bifunctional diguanylate cyclase/phosphodiesterase [Acidovorax lacteus]|uniref:EAL domain-containing protein n=1 Tax=Acidovorax lacteus TaxID=1924988 RepID=A0ABP8LBZ8_9BURK
MPDTSSALSASTPGNDLHHTLLRLVAESDPGLLAYFGGAELRCAFANARYASFAGHTVDSIVGLTPPEALGQEAWTRVQPHVERCLQGHTVRYLREHPLPRGGHRVVEVQLIPHQATLQTPPVGLMVRIDDITEQWQAERAVRESNERIRKFTEATEEAVVFHQQGRIVDGNLALERLTGYALDELRGHPTLDFVAPAYRAAAEAYVQAGREDPYEAAITHRDGRTIPVEIVGKTMPLHGTSYRVAILRDISLRKQAQERSAFMALHDVLTQLPNRRSLLEQLAQRITRARRQGRQIAVLLLDLDHFRTVNESLGHLAGDHLLCGVAGRLLAALGADDLLARLGGDQFVAVLDPLEPPGDATATAAAERLRDALRTPFELAGMPVTVTSSVGIGLFPVHAGTGDALLRCADAALHHARRIGPGMVQCYDPAMDSRALEILQRERLLREAIATGAFVLHFQPQTDLRTGELCGLEALVRWRHPHRGIVGPQEFIGFCEARGLISPIGRWVLREACRQMKAWLDAGWPQVPVAVNLSALEFRQRDMVAEVAEVLQSTGLPPSCLEIELTESVLMHPEDGAQDTLNALKALGVRIAIDDFGTGYSSLAYLKRYPLDQIKIDRSFVMDTPDNADDVAIVTAIVQMARSLQLQTVAEGVETQAQVELLRALGCDICQGHVVAAPMEAAALAAWWEAWQAGGMARARRSSPPPPSALGRPQ